jgi:hypothetical protein
MKVVEADGILYGLYVDAFSNMSDNERLWTAMLPQLL